MKFVFTEHIDYGVKTDLNCDCEKSLMNFKKYRQIYKDKINLKMGYGIWYSNKNYRPV